MNYYKRHLGDYARDTGHLSALEHGIYTLLLDWYYINECPIPHEKAKRIARGNPEETQTVLDEFFIDTPQGWKHARADREIAEYKDKAERNREAGKLGGRPKKTQTVSKRNPDVTLATSHKPLANTEQKQKKGQGASAPACPEDVDPQTWTDWLALRKAKRAPVTETVLREARNESAKAGMTFGQFLAVWCRRGSQGLEADWLKPNERAGPSATKPSAAANFRGTDYGTTDIDSLPADMRDAVRRELGNG